MYRYDEARQLLKSILADFRVLSGDEIGDGPFVPWPNRALDVAINLAKLSNMMAEARLGKIADPPIVLPSPEDLE